MRQNAIFVCLIVLLGLVFADSTIENQLRNLSAQVDAPAERFLQDDAPKTDEEYSVPGDAWAAFIVGGAILLFVIGAIIW